MWKSAFSQAPIASFFCDMRAIIQRVKAASVEVEGQKIAAVGRGLLIFLGVEHEDKEADALWLVGKIKSMRIFADEAGKMNLSVEQINGEVLVVSQFTLHASTRKGNRPSFIRAAAPEQAETLYRFFCEQMAQQSALRVQTGAFGADMQVELLNDGPVTIWMDSRKRE